MKKVDPRRRKRLEQYVRDNLTLKEIGDREGMEPSNLSTIRSDIAAELGIKLPKEGRPYPVAFGLTKDSWSLRYHLGNMLLKLILAHGREEAASMTGVPVKLQIIATGQNAKLHYDWRFSQMERLAKARGQTFAQLIAEINKPDLKGF